MKTKVVIIDLSALGLVGISAFAMAYAAYLFETKVADGLAKGIVSLFR